MMNDDDGVAADEDGTEVRLRWVSRQPSPPDRNSGELHTFCLYILLQPFSG
ncbi:hypothetical protein HanPI659440_Chr12g0459591 [Helianthus annuus]|nr:hypothetical protein HanPI659440_Chr12g0459581 [Helianthus annuus]KAJ0725509.1 hypothetical protein HanPI659440_Chr12g0459591 [Helianthus annuus]